jgi:predicted 3-demethylubiquinone-9 3-methyltransferase (glyoxalase superfamily)
MPELTPFLWFDDQAEEAAQYYTSIFDDGKITRVKPNGAAGPGALGTVLTVEFELAGLRFIALNAGPQFPFTEAVSIMVTVDTQEELDRYWDALTQGGEPGPCGWLKDKFGLSWQIFPKLYWDLRYDGEPAKSEAIMAAVLQMGKIESSVLQEAYDNA